MPPRIDSTISQSRNSINATFCFILAFWICFSRRSLVIHVCFELNQKLLSTLLALQPLVQLPTIVWSIHTFVPYPVDPACRVLDKGMQRKKVQFLSLKCKDFIDPERNKSLYIFHRIFPRGLFSFIVQ